MLLSRVNVLCSEKVSFLLKPHPCPNFTFLSLLLSQTVVPAAVLEEDAADAANRVQNDHHSFQSIQLFSCHCLLLFSYCLLSYFLFIVLPRVQESELVSGFMHIWNKANFSRLYIVKYSLSDPFTWFHVSWGTAVMANAKMKISFNKPIRCTKIKDWGQVETNVSARSYTILTQRVSFFREF